MYESLICLVAKFAKFTERFLSMSTAYVHVVNYDIHVSTIELEFNFQNADTSLITIHVLSIQFTCVN